MDIQHHIARQAQTVGCYIRETANDGSFRAFALEASNHSPLLQ